MSQQAHRAVAGQERQGIRLVIGFIVLDRNDLEDRVVAGEGDVRESTRGQALAEGNTPLAGDLQSGRPKALRHPRRDAPGRDVEPRAFAVAHR